MNSDAESTCPQCRAPIPEGAPRGLCPRCLMDAAMASDPKPAAKEPAPPVAELNPAFPQLEIQQLHGSGGMGLVYKARQPHLDRIVALKILPLGLARDPAFSERFAREARALAKLNHPNIVQCYDFGQTEPLEDGVSGYFYLLLEYVDGVNLRQTMHAGTLTAREALGIVPRLCDALHYAHEQGVLHRDIKPENILLDKQGRVKIADFGLARFQKGDDAESMMLTASGAQLGTAAYMAPEQIEQPHDVDHRADIYSLGVVFYEMLTGGLPLGRFAAPSETSGVDPRLDSVVFRTLEKQADKRYQSAGEVRTQVEGIAGSPTPKKAAAAFSTSESKPSGTSLRSIAALAFPPSWTALPNWYWRQPFLRSRGNLALEPNRLVYTGEKATLVIPLDAIEEVSLAPLPFHVEPLGRCPLAIRWRDPTGTIQSTRFLLKSVDRVTSLAKEQDDVDGWLQAIRETTAKATGKAPTCAHDSRLTCAALTPEPPDLSTSVWVILLLLAAVVAIVLITSGPFILLGLPLAFAVSLVSIGLLRRQEPEKVTESEEEPPSPLTDLARSAFARIRSWIPKRSKVPRPSAQGFAATDVHTESISAEPRGPAWSRLAIVAFAFATIGWFLFLVGPLIGCVLGWIALLQIKRSESEKKGRRLALFAAVQVPLVVLIGGLGGAAFGLWDHGEMPFDYPVTFLILAVLVFLGARFIFKMAGVGGLMNWRRKAGITAGLVGLLLLVGSVWAMSAGQTRWPFRGQLVRAAVYHENVDRWAIKRALQESAYHGRVHQMPFLKKADETVLFAIADHKEDAVELLLQAGDDLRKQEPSASVRVFPNTSLRGWPPRANGKGPDEVYAMMTVLSCASGLLLAVSGASFGWMSLIIGVVSSITLIQLGTPIPIGYPVQQVDYSQSGRAAERDALPDHAFRIR